MTAERLEASVIVALNPHSIDAKEVFDAYLQQTMPPGSFEVIIVDGGRCPGGGDAFAEHLRRCPAAPVSLIAAVRPGRAACNNAGVHAARSDLLVFVADDFIPSPTLVRAHVEFHLHLLGDGHELRVHAIANRVEALRGLLIQALKLDLQLLRGQQQRIGHLTASVAQAAVLLFPARGQLLLDRATNL